MTEDSTNAQPTAIPKGFGRTPQPAWQVCLLISLIALVCWFYVWTAFPIYRGPLLSTDNHSYYSLQAGGFLKGKLSLDAKADPVLATLENPWDPAQRGGRGLHDASYYKGEYHMYFGVGPVVMLFLPFRLLTGYSISESDVSVIFSSLGFVLSVLLLNRLWRRYFRSVSFFWVLACAFALGLGTMVPALLRRPSIWEVPISCAYFCAMLFFWAVYMALHSRSRLTWIAVASGVLGLAVGARPTYLFACVAILVPVVAWLRRNERHAGAKVGLFRALAAAIVPAALVGVGLAAYNYLRFESVFEFGQKYQMAGDDVTKLKFFSWDYPLYGLRLYLLQPAGLTPYFPFITVITAPPPPPGQLGVENPYGILSNMPFVWLVAASAWFVFRGGRSGGAFGLRTLVGTILLFGAVTLITVSCFGGVTGRYMIDFLPAITLASCLGALILLQATVGRWVRGILKGLVGLLVFGTCLFNVLVSFQHNELLRAENPELYRRLARVGNKAALAVENVVGSHYGPLEMKVVFPKGTPGAVEAFVVTGSAFQADYLYVNYLTETSLRFALEHTSHGSITGDFIEVKPGQVQTVRVDMGSLYPPGDHPYFENLTKSQARAVRRTLAVTVDGQVALRTYAEFYDATSRIPSLGTSEDRPGFKVAFSGQILSWKRLPNSLPEPPPIQYGVLRLELRMPPFSGIRSEPLLSLGEPSKGDLFYIRYEAPDQISFGHDNWGGSSFVTKPIAVDPRGVQVVEIDLNALHAAMTEPPAGVQHYDHLRLSLNGQVIVDQRVPLHYFEADTLMVGKNSIRASSAFAAFSGELISVTRVPR